MILRNLRKNGKGRSQELVVLVYLIWLIQSFLALYPTYLLDSKFCSIVMEGFSLAGDRRFLEMAGAFKVAAFLTLYKFFNIKYTQNNPPALKLRRTQSAESGQLPENGVSPAKEK